MNPPEVASSFFRPLQANLRLGQEVPDDRPDVETVLGAGDPFAFGPEVRKIIYTTNAIESLHMQLLKVIKNRGHFPSDQSSGTATNVCAQSKVTSLGIIAYHALQSS